jgi:hypothetical protein
VHIVEELGRVLGSVIIDNEEFILLQYIMNTGDKTQQQCNRIYCSVLELVNLGGFS